MATANVLTEATTVNCSHKGEVSKSSTAKLQVGGHPVLLENQVSSWTIPTGTAPPACTRINTQAGEKPCTKVGSPTEGTAAKLTVEGSKVLLDSLQATTDGLPTPGNTLASPTGEPKLQVG
jgi:hypothetical protein